MFGSVSKSRPELLCKDRDLNMFSVSARFRHVSVSKFPQFKFDDFEVFLNRAQGFFVRTVL